jgi:hypothetical protein
LRFSSGGDWLAKLSGIRLSGRLKYFFGGSMMEKYFRKMKRFRCFGFAAMAVLIPAMLTTGCHQNGEGGEPDTMAFNVNDGDSLSAALEEIGKRAAPGGGEYTVNVSADITSGGWIIAGDEYNGKHITIKSDDKSQARVIQYTKTVRFLFEIANGALTLADGLTLIGVADNDKALCRVIFEGTLILRDGVIIKGNTNTTSGDPDGEAYRGGGGIEARDGGKLFMYGGEITGNEARRGNGAGVFGRIKKAAFVMEGGRIHDNTTTLSASWGGGVHINFINDTFTMNGGVIDFNKTARNGGGVSLCCGTFTINGSAVISDNEAGASGGGVSMCCCNVYMTGGVIKKNKAGTNASVNAGSADVFRYGGGIGRSGSATAAKPFPGVWDAPNLFVKTGGIIYGSDGGENANAVVNSFRSPMDYADESAAHKKGAAVFMLKEYKDTTLDNTPSGNYRFEDTEEYNPMGY